MVSKIRLALLDPGRIPLIIGSALTASSNFFINYITIQAGPLPTSASGETRGEPTILLLAVASAFMSLPRWQQLDLQCVCWQPVRQLEH